LFFILAPALTLRWYIYSTMIGFVRPLNALPPTVAEHDRVHYSLLVVISVRFLLDLRMLKSEDQEYKSRHSAASPARAADTRSSSAAFSTLTGLNGLVDEFELEDSPKVQGPIAEDDPRTFEYP